jgi:hypothetical protein
MLAANGNSCNRYIVAVEDCHVVAVSCLQRPQCKPTGAKLANMKLANMKLANMKLANIGHLRLVRSGPLDSDAAEGEVDMFITKKIDA